MTDKKTKIIATIGPASSEEKVIAELISAGVDVFRFNMKHADVAWHEQMIDLVQGVADSMGKIIGILIDLQGPEIRIKLEEEFDVDKGDVVSFVRETQGKLGVVGVKHESFFEALEKGDKFSIDDGFIEFEVVAAAENKLTARAQSGGRIKHNKGLNLVEKDLDVPSLIDDDIEKLHLATRKRIDFVALSFVRSRDDIVALRKVMKELKIDAGIVSKVESKRGLDNIDEIITESDAVMIARGDLGIEVPIEQLTYHQKTIIAKCRVAKTPVIVATQMLESMIAKPVPTRAEATDVANAVFDGTDAVMLSGESAMGKYPVRAVSEMAKIVKFNERVCVVPAINLDIASDAELVINAASTLAATAQQSGHFDIDHIVAVTESGATARAVASYRPKMPIIALTPSAKVMEELKLSYGVVPAKIDYLKPGELIQPDVLLGHLKKAGKVKEGQLILVVYGQRKDIPGKTNSIVLMRVS